jgi:hypothetical protein
MDIIIATNQQAFRDALRTRRLGRFDFAQATFVVSVCVCSRGYGILAAFLRA